jgi:autotransporter-associated beta strand protein
VNIGASGPGTLDLNGYNQALAGLTDGGANAKLVTNGAPTPSLLTLNIPAGSAFSGVIAGNLGLVKNDVGVLTLSGTNAYTGNTTVNGGTLQIAVASLAVVSTVSVSNGAVLQLDFMETNKVSALLFNGISQAPGLYNAGTSSTYITGWGNLLVSPVATNPTNIATSVTGTNLTLSWPTDHTGWRLLVQTNNLVRGISTNPADWGVVSGSANTNQVIIPIDPGKPTEFYRLVYP